MAKGIDTREVYLRYNTESINYEDLGSEYGVSATTIMHHVKKFESKIAEATKYLETFLQAQRTGRDKIKQLQRFLEEARVSDQIDFSEGITTNDCVLTITIDRK